MKLVFRLAIVVSWLTMLTSVTLGQKTTTNCSCASPDNSCDATATCQGGCTAFCSTTDSCHVGCRIDWIYERITISFSQKTGEEMIEMVSRQLYKGRSQKILEFKPFVGQEGRKFDLVLKDDSLWRLFDYLSKHGTVKIRGADFEKKLKPLRGYTTTGLSWQVNGVPAKYAVAELSFLTGKTLRVSARHAKRPISISVENATLDEILRRIYKETGVTIRTR